MTQQRIAEKFRSAREAGRTVLVAYLILGYPDLETSYLAARAALLSGADLLELGVPFSDPTADGPVIAKASYEAIQRGGSLKAALAIAQRLRAEFQETPFVLFSYYNPIVAFGESVLPAAAREAGIDGLLLVDLPPEEGQELRKQAAASELAVIPLIAPTSGAAREERIIRQSSGFVYYVSVTGVTGSGVAPLEEAGQHAALLEKQYGLPVVVGFGIDTPEKASLTARAGASGVVVGTGLIRALSCDSPDEGVRAVESLVRSLRSGLESVS